MDDEIKGEGNSVNYKYRMHDPRIGRFFAVDPLTAKYPHYTPYSFSGNKLIAFRELEGLEEFQSNTGEGKYLGQVSDNGETYVVNDDRHWNYYSSLKTAYDNGISTVVLFGTEIPVNEENVQLALDRLLVNSTRIDTDLNGMIRNWYAHNVPKSRTNEYATNIYKKTFINSDGDKFIGYLAGQPTWGDDKRNGGASVNLRDSELYLNNKKICGFYGGGGWGLAVIMHTHPSRNIVADEGISIPDAKFSLMFGVPILMMAYTENSNVFDSNVLHVFSPQSYRIATNGTFAQWRGVDAIDTPLTNVVESYMINSISRWPDLFIAPYDLNEIIINATVR